MPDDLNRRQPEDPDRINIEQQWEVEYWAKHFNIDNLTLRLAALAAGPMVADVQKWLKENGKI